MPIVMALKCGTWILGSSNPPRYLFFEKFSNVFEPFYCQRKRNKIIQPFRYSQDYCDLRLLCCKTCNFHATDRMYMNEFDDNHDWWNGFTSYLYLNILWKADEYYVFLLILTL